VKATRQFHNRLQDALVITEVDPIGNVTLGRRIADQSPLRFSSSHHRNVSAALVAWMFVATK
jgi:hypothetical protein